MRVSLPRLRRTGVATAAADGGCRASRAPGCWRCSARTLRWPATRRPTRSNPGSRRRSSASSRLTWNGRRRCSRGPTARSSSASSAPTPSSTSWCAPRRACRSTAGRWSVRRWQRGEPGGCTSSTSRIRRRHDWPKRSPTLKGQPVLVVTESSRALALGSMINFVVVDDKVRFDIAPQAAEASRLRISARLLGVARTLIGRP